MRLTLALLASASLLAACAPAQTEIQGDDAAAISAGALTRSATMADFFDCIRESGQGQLSAHRAGPAPGAAENSLYAIRRSADLGAAVAEIDVARTTDGVLILLHDRTLDRTTTGEGAIAEMSFADLDGLTLADNDGEDTGEPIPTLDAALALSRELGIYLQLDLKNAGMEEVIEAVREAGMVEHAGLITYRPDQAVAAHALAPQLHLSAPDAIDLYQSEGIDLSRLSIWLGVGAPDAARDAALAELEIETGAGLFRLEDEAGADPYSPARATGVELMSVDNVSAAIAAIGGSEALTAQIAECRAG